MRLPKHKDLHHHFLFKLRKIVMFSLCSVLICGCADSVKSSEERGLPLALLFHYSGFCLRGEGMGLTFSVCTIFCSVIFPFYCYEYCCITLMKNRYDSSPVFIILHFCQLFSACRLLLMTLCDTQKLMPFKIDLWWNSHQHSWINQNRPSFSTKIGQTRASEW